ncbi:hypothetical protein KA005_30690 [bacterium]|nr:hypothetical protein [bacterium]
MNTELMGLKDGLQVERQQLAERLNEIDNKLASIDTVLDLLKKQHAQSNKAQMPLLDLNRIPGRFSGMPFKKSVILLLKDDQEKTRTPKEIVKGLLKEGFESKSKNFNNTARTMLMYLRKKGEIKSIKTERSYLYSYKKPDPVIHGEQDLVQATEG